MNLVCFDTCIEVVSLTLLKENSFFCEKKWPRSFQDGPTCFLIPALEELCREEQFSLHQLEGIVVSRGPGSFTGIRIGLSAAQGLSLALQKPLVAVSLFEVWKMYAHTLFPQHILWVMVNTYGAFWAIQPYNEDGSCRGEAFLLSPASLFEELKKREGLKAPLVLVGWNIRTSLPVESLSWRMCDLAETEVNNASLLAKYILNTPALLQSSPPPEPYYLNSPFAVKTG